MGGITGGFSVEDDYQRVKAVRQAVGPDVRIMLDGNKGWDVDATIQASMCHVRMAPHHEPPVHGHLLASIPNGYILESFANPGRDPFWFEIYGRKPKIEKSVLYLDDTPGQGIEFNQKAIDRYGTAIVL